MGEKKELDVSTLNPGTVRGELIYEWTRVEKPVRDRIRLRWPRLAELLDTLAAAS